MQRIAVRAGTVLFVACTLGGVEHAQDGWSLVVEPYLWVPVLEGEGSAEGSAEVDLGIDFVGELSAGFPLALRLEAPGKRWALMVDGLYARWNEDDGSIRSETEVGLVEVGVGLPLRGPWELTAGLRGVQLDLDLEIGATDANADESWIDPWIGGRGDLELGERWSLRVLGDVGGFGVGSDFTWQAATLLAWSSGRWRVELGYRALALDFDDDELEADLVAHGPILGVAATF